MVCWWPWRHRYRAVVVRLGSGNRLPVMFLTWRTAKQAAAWCDRSNASEGPDPLTRWEYERID